MRNWYVMRLAPCLAVALATAVGGGALLAAPAGAATPLVAGAPLVAEAAAATTVPGVPTIPTTVPLPTQSTSLTPVSAPPTTAAAINDAKATELVNRVVAALIGLGVLIGLLTFWYWRSTKPVPPSLEGVELMSTRKWLRGKPDKRARLLGEYHAKRGPVPEESIARVSGGHGPGRRSSRGSRTRARSRPEPAMAAAPARGSAPEAVDLGDLTEEPPAVTKGEDGEGQPEPAGPPTPPRRGRAPTATSTASSPSWPGGRATRATPARRRKPPDDPRHVSGTVDGHGRLRPRRDDRPIS